MRRCSLPGQPSPVGPQGAKGRRLLNHQVPPEAALDLDYFPERSLVTEHAVDPFHQDNRFPRTVAEPEHAPFQISHIVMAKTDDLRTSQLAGVVDARVAVGVKQHHLARPRQRSDDAQVGDIPGREHNDGTPPQKINQFVLQRAVPGLTAGCHANARGSGAFKLQ